jgi:negative regulator of flagellin synthesis FlgM
MLTSSDFDAVSPVSRKKTYHISYDREAPARTAATPKYDSVTLSEQTEEGQVHRALVSRLSGEVRTATSTGDIQRLRQEVAEDRYQPNPEKIAGNILFLDEEENA